MGYHENLLLLRSKDIVLWTTNNRRVPCKDRSPFLSRSLTCSIYQKGTTRSERGRYSSICTDRASAARIWNWSSATDRQSLSQRGSHFHLSSSRHNARSSRAG